MFSPAKREEINLKVTETLHIQVRREASCAHFFSGNHFGPLMFAALFFLILAMPSYNYQQWAENFIITCVNSSVSKWDKRQEMMYGMEQINKHL